jgi:cytochrome c
VGPAYNAVAARYERTDETTSMLVNKILKGGKGNWGERAMPAQAVSEQEAGYIVDYILSLDERSSVPLTGVIRPDNAGGQYQLTATYTDQGGKGSTQPITRTQQITLRSARMQAENFGEKFNARTRNNADEGYSYVDRMKDGSYLVFDRVDFRNVSALNLRVAATTAGASVTVKLKDGKVVGTVEVPDTQGATNWTEVTIPVDNLPPGQHQLHVVASLPEESPEEAGISVDWIYFKHSAVARRLASTN